MSEIEKMLMVKTMTGVSDEEVLSTYLAIAGSKILHRMYPYSETVNAEVPDKYAYTQVEVAAYLINKRGAEGEISHSENGISRSYENADIPNGLMREVVPHAATIQ